MAIILEYTTEELRCVVYFLWAKGDSMQRIFIKKCFLFTVASVCRVKQFTTGSRNPLKDDALPRRPVQIATETKTSELRGSTRWDKFVEDLLKNKCFFFIPGWNITRFTFHIYF
jgi:hypothetical protein